MVVKLRMYSRACSAMRLVLFQSHAILRIATSMIISPISNGMRMSQIGSGEALGERPSRVKMFADAESNGGSTRPPVRWAT